VSDSRRRAPRVPLDVTVNCGASAIAHTKDISAGGLCLIINEPIEAGKMIHLTFGLPGQTKTITGFAKVAWCRKASTQYYSAGLEFWDIDESAKQAILAYLNQHVSS
jgi:c-di-GMP-binding flagellar brake protein YcgR